MLHDLFDPLLYNVLVLSILHTEEKQIKQKKMKRKYMDGERERGKAHTSSEATTRVGEAKKVGVVEAFLPVVENININN